MNRDQIKVDLKSYALKNGKVELSEERYPTFENECELKITRNGYQYQCLTIARHEAKKIIELLSKHFGINDKELK